ncbi:Lipoprotein signal peptidase [Frankliniella fusca]|uniref:Lipoprotein signal peptidase n=1 Tax=Frankliniella fusca TaxID=407009 RepID=A0AAE1LCU1_9NEOP|nr:Lipoprotein signal peptidase [Frankliniella fusca]
MTVASRHVTHRAVYLHLVVGQHQGVDLDGVDQIRVVADDARQLGLADLSQLLCEKRTMALAWRAGIPELLHDLLAEDDGQELVVGDVLDLRDDDAPGLLVEGLVVPVRVDGGQAARHGVVLARHERVHARQHQLLVDSDLAGLEAVHGAVGAGAALVRDVELERQQVLEAVLAEHGVHAQQAVVAQANFALQLKGWRENMENFCGSKPPEGGCGSRQAQGFYPLWQPTASVFHGNRRFADCDPIAQFDRFDPRTTIGLPLEVRAVSRALDFLIPVSEALPQRGTRDSNPQPRVPTRSQNRKRPNAQSHRANGVEPSIILQLHFVQNVLRKRTTIGFSSWTPIMPAPLTASRLYLQGAAQGVDVVVEQRRASGPVQEQGALALVVHLDGGELDGEHQVQRGREDQQRPVGRQATRSRSAAVDLRSGEQQGWPAT